MGSMTSLWQELREGSCQLELIDGRLHRCVEPTFIELRYGHKVLVEALQVLEDGRERKRNMLLAEKVEPGDKDAFATAIRAIREELGVNLGQYGPADGSILCRDDLYRTTSEFKDSV